MSGIRGVAKTYQAIINTSHKLLETNNTRISQTIERTTKQYEKKVDNTHWQAASSGLSLGAGGIAKIFATALESGLLEGVSTGAIKAAEIYNTVLHGDDIRADSEIKQEDHRLSTAKGLEQQVNQLDEQLGREVSQLMQQENDEFRL